MTFYEIYYPQEDIRLYFKLEKNAKKVFKKETKQIIIEEMEYENLTLQEALSEYHGAIADWQLWDVIVLQAIKTED